MTPFKLDYEEIINSAKTTQWEKDFAESVYQYSKTKPITDKQQAIWNRLLEKIRTEPKKLSFNDLKEDQKLFVANTHMLLTKTKDKWAIDFTNSLLDQMYQGKELSDKQKTTFETLFNKKMNKDKK
jgi:hypothetical protein